MIIFNYMSPYKEIRYSTKFLFKSIIALSPISLIGSCYYNLPLIIKMLNMFVILSSIIYWNDPMSSFHRDIDRFFVFINMILHYMLGLKISIIFCITRLIIDWSIYNLSWYLFHRKYFNYADYIWILLHIIVHSNNIFLYKYLGNNKVYI